MPSPFDITVATNTVNLDNNREGVATITAKNNTRRRIRGTARVTTTPAEGAAWVTILPPESGGTDSANVRDFPIDSTQQYQLKITVPMTAAPASYTLKLTLADEVNPDENFTESPDVLFTVREAPKPEPRPFPMWIIPAVVIALLVIVAIISIGVTSANNAANANATATEVAVIDARNLADTQTAVALGGTQAAASQTAAAQTQAAATQAAVGIFTGTWRPVNSGIIDGIGITSTGNNQMSVSYTSRCPPNQNLCFTTPSTFTFTNVPFTPSQLAAAGSALQMLIVPANNSQILVTINAGGDTSVQTFTRRRFIDDIIIDSVFEMPTSRLSQSQLNQFQLIITPGS